ncbi:protein PAT1 homolog 2 isoform X1 [Balearica regulorum gibbericeps]|uniref:protein PAT1 homolog 2 isoform X1 n=1 Tax=Balearica regulorum gibbericeps TaxID=100784 RepID=UPI003F5DA389
MAEEDEELDLYNEMTFGLDRDSTEEDVAKALMPPETSPELAEAVAEETEAGEELGPGAAEQPEELGEPQEEGGMEPEVEQVSSELEEEEEDLGAEEHEEDQEPCEETNDLGDPAVMKAVQSKPTLESQDSAVLDSRIGACWAEFGKEDTLAMDPAVWGSCPGSIPPHHVLEVGTPGQALGDQPRAPQYPELRVMQVIWGDHGTSKALSQDKAILQVLERPPPSTNVALDFLGSPVQRGYGGSPRLKRPDFRLMSSKSFPQRFLRQQSPLMPRSPCSPRPFTPARRPSPLFASNQTAGYASPTPFRPMSPNISSPPRPLTMHFGPMSPSLDPALFFSPSASGQLNLSTASHMTQLHPQHQRILTQRQQQGGQVQSISPKKMWSPKVDPYAGLMVSKEKDWVVKVEMIQLQSENMDDDYYYQTYYHRLERKQAEEELLGGRNKQEPPKLVTPFIQKVETYDSVVRIAGSLGQVAVSTCYSPRRAIDAVHHALVEEAAGSHRLRALHRIEKLFLQLLEVEEMQRKMSPAPEEQQQPCCQEQRNQEVERIYQALKIRACSSEEEAEDEFLQLLCVRKGKKLTARLLPHLTQEQAEKILLTVTHHLPFLMKKDMLDESLPLLYSPLNEVVGRMTFSKLIEVLQEMTRPLSESPELPLAMALKNQFGISLLYSLLSHGERLLSSDAPLEPRGGDFEMWTDTVFLVARELSQVPKALLVEPLFLPSNLLSLFCRYLDKQTIHHLEAKMECSPLPSEAAMPC